MAWNVVLIYAESVLVRCSNNAYRGCPCGVMVKAMDCGIVVREFVLQSRYYVHFCGKRNEWSVTCVLRAPFRGIYWQTWMSISLWYLWSELRVGGVRVRGEHNLYIQVQSPLPRHSNSRYRRDQTRPLFFYPRNWDSPVNRPSWAGRLKSNSFLQPQLLPAF